MKRMLVSSLFFSCNECSEKEIKGNKKEERQRLQKEKKWNEEWNKRKTKLKERERERERLKMQEERILGQRNRKIE